MIKTNKFENVESLDKLFKKNSKYYKKINNNDIIAIRWNCGAGGEFITGLFLDKSYNKDMSIRVAGQPVENNQYYGHVPQFEGRLLKYNTTADYSTIQDILHLNISEEIIKKYDDLLYKTFTDLGNKKFVSLHGVPHSGFIISKFYLKNSEKIKIVDIDISKAIDNYVNILCMVKTGAEAYDSYRNINKPGASVTRRHRLMDRKQHQYIFNVIDEIYQTINISKSTTLFGIVSQIIEGIILDENSPSFYDNKIWFFETIKTHLINLLNNIGISKDNDNVKTVFKNQLCTIDYKGLFFNQDMTIIKDLMNFYESTKQPDYYRTQIKKYHTENLKLVNEIKRELPTTIKNVRKEIQNNQRE